MATVLKRKARSLFVNKRPLQEMTARINKEMGFSPLPDVTVESLRGKMLEQGVRPEDNIGSRGIIAARDEE